MTRTPDTDTTTTLAELEQVLDSYGADAARWPAARRDALTAFSRFDARGARLLAETTAFEALLALAPRGEASDRLKSGIVAAAVGDGSRDARIVPLSVARRPRRRPALWQAAAVLAASFALGLYLGVAGLADPALRGALNYAAVDGSAEEGEDLFGSAGSWLSDQEERL